MRRRLGKRLWRSHLTTEVNTGGGADLREGGKRMKCLEAGTLSRMGGGNPQVHGGNLVFAAAFTSTLVPWYALSQQQAHVATTTGAVAYHDKCTLVQPHSRFGTTTRSFGYNKNCKLGHRAVLEGKKAFETQTETNIHWDALCFMVKTGARHNTTETVLNNGWRLAVGGGWWLVVDEVAVSGWWSLGAVLKGCP